MCAGQMWMAMSMVGVASHHCAWDKEERSSIPAITARWHGLQEVHRQANRAADQAAERVHSREMSDQAQEQCRRAQAQAALGNQAI